MNYTTASESVWILIVIRQKGSGGQFHFKMLFFSSCTCTCMSYKNVDGRVWHQNAFVHVHVDLHAWHYQGKLIGSTHMLWQSFGNYKLSKY